MTGVTKRAVLGRSSVACMYESGKGAGREDSTDLNAAAYSDSDSEVHLILTGHRNGRDVFGSISDNGKDDQTDEGFAHAAVGDKVVDTADEKLRTYRH